MNKLCYLFVVAIIASEAVSMNLRNKRQSNDNNNDLEDRYGWDRPRQRPWFPLQQFPAQQQQQPTPSPNNGNANGSTSQPTSVRNCITQCPVTPEYNPVCGTDNITYTNPGRLNCAIECGVTVSLLRASPCPTTTTPAPN